MASLNEYRFTLLTMRSGQLDHVNIQAVDSDDAFEQVMGLHPGRLIINAEILSGFSIVGAGLQYAGRREESRELFDFLSGCGQVHKGMEDWFDEVLARCRRMGVKVEIGEKIHLLSRGMIIETRTVGQMLFC